MSGVPWRVMADGVELAVRVTPRAGREAIGGVVADAAGRPQLAIRVSAPPADGRANEAVVRLLARALGVARSRVVLVRGASARSKSLHIHGPPAELEARLRQLVGVGQRGS